MHKSGPLLSLSINAVRRCVLAVVGATSVAAHGQTFYELESQTMIEPAAEYLKIALLGQDMCNVSRELKGLPRQPRPTLPAALLFERVWTVSNGRDFVLRRRTYSSAPNLVDDLDCRWTSGWSEQILIQRRGTTTRISRSNDGPPEIERDAFIAPWSLDRVDGYPLRANALGLAIRCATPEALRKTDILRPMIGMSEICVPEAPVFRDEDGFNLVVRSTADASMFGGKGGEFRALQRVSRYGVFNVIDRTWDPRTYLSD